MVDRQQQQIFQSATCHSTSQVCRLTLRARLLPTKCFGHLIEIVQIGVSSHLSSVYAAAECCATRSTGLLYSNLFTTVCCKLGPYGPPYSYASALVCERRLKNDMLWCEKGTIIGLLPQKVLWVCLLFLQRGGTIECTVTCRAQEIFC